MTIDLPFHVRACAAATFASEDDLHQFMSPLYAIWFSTLDFGYLVAGMSVNLRGQRVVLLCIAGFSRKPS